MKRWWWWWCWWGWAAYIHTHYTRAHPPTRRSTRRRRIRYTLNSRPTQQKTRPPNLIWISKSNKSFWSTLLKQKQASNNSNNRIRHYHQSKTAYKLYSPPQIILNYIFISTIHFISSGWYNLLYMECRTVLYCGLYGALGSFRVLLGAPASSSFFTYFL